MRWLLAAVISLGPGCNWVFGLEQSRPGTDAPASDADLRPDAPVDAPVDAPIDGVPLCTGVTTCVQEGIGAATAACAAMPVAGCVAVDWVYCGCGSGVGRSVFVFPNINTAARTDVIIVAEAGLVETRLDYGGCWGPPSVSCPTDRGTCTGSGKAIYRWDAVPHGPGTYGVSLWINDINAPCTANDGGSILASWTVTRP